MASSNRLVVEVVGDTSKLSASLNKAQTEINRFAGRSKIRSTGADPLLADIRRMQTETDALAKRAQEVEARSRSLNQSFARTGAGAVAAGLAVNALGRNFQELGGNAGKLGNALSDLSTGNIVGFVKGLQSINETNPGKMAADLIRFGDAAKATEAANKAAAAGFDSLAEAARAATLEILGSNEAMAAAARIVAPGEGNLGGSNGGFEAFRGTPLPKPRKGITQEQRNTFFDNDIARLLDRSQDGSLPDQVKKLQEIKRILIERQKIQTDVTRKLNLGDQIAAVTRQRSGVLATIADNAKRRAEEAKRAAEELKREREAREKALEEARRVALQAKQFRALGFAADGSDVVPGADNLRKQLASLTERLGSSSVNLSSKLENQLDGVRKVLSGKFGQVTRESREKIQELFDTIRGEFDKESSGPLTKTTSLNTNKILEGLGLSPEEERKVRARLSGFNSAGQGLAAGAGSVGAFGQPIIVKSDVYLDNQKVGTSLTKTQQKTARANPQQKRGFRPF